MPTEYIPIELDGRGFSGIVRQEGFPGESLPDLIAHRPEPWRFLRLARIVGAAKGIAHSELGQQEAKLLINSMVSISDYKGDFGVIWRLPKHNETFELVVDRALSSMGELEILHVLESEE
ncbi:hypothetical protein [Sphingomonas koreensis]